MAQKDSRSLERTKTPGVYRRGDSYVVRWKHRGQSHKRIFPTYSEAREFKRSLSGAAKQPTTRQTVGEYYEGWIDSYRGRPLAASKRRRERATATRSSATSCPSRPAARRCGT
jgi:hypothetical protein